MSSTPIPSGNLLPPGSRPFRAELRCMAGCAQAFPLDAAQIRCPACDGLFEVVHDLDALRQIGPAAWRQTFDARWAPQATSGVWAKQEWLSPGIDPSAIVALGEGHSPLQAAPRYAAAVAKLRGRSLGNLWIKQCGLSHTGSFKDLGMTVLVSWVAHMRAHGRPIEAVGCASTGDTSAALAAYAAAAGIPSVVILPRGKISTAQLVQPLASGARVLAADTDFDGCMRLIKQLADEGRVYLANSMNALRLEGQKTVAIELAQQLGWRAPDWVIIPGGNLGNVSALAAGFDLMLALGVITNRPRICVAQAANADPLYRSFVDGYAPLVPQQARATAASAIQIGHPVSFPRAVRALRAYDGVVTSISEQALAEAAARADAHGLYACPHTGVALGAYEQLTAAGTITATDDVVVVSTTNALKFTEFKVSYHEDRLADVTGGNHRNRPIEIDATVDAVRRALEAP